MAAPTKFNQEVADTICEEIATSSKSLRTICKQEGMPAVRSVLNWLSEGEKSEEGHDLRRFLHQYARAREMQADFLAEEIIEIADDSSDDVLRTKKVKNADGSEMILLEEHKEFTNRSKLRVEARKWIASKLKPKKYGDKVDMTHGGEIGIKQITGMEVK